MRTLINSADCCGKWFFASAALEKAPTRTLSLQFGSLIDYTTMWANWTVGPADRFKVLTGSVFVVEDLVSEIDWHSMTPKCEPILRRIARYVKSIVADN